MPVNLAHLTIQRDFPEDHSLRLTPLFGPARMSLV